MKVGVIGGGVVGTATARVWTEHADVRVYDLVPERRTHERYMLWDCDIIFVCLPTPAAEAGVDITALANFFADIPEEARKCNFAIRSTVNVGNTEWLKAAFALRSVMHFPEFLTARTAYVDACIPTRHLLGYTDSGDAFADFALALKARFPGVPLHHMNSRETEYTKLMQNAFFATKIAFFNEAFAGAKTLGCDWHRVLSALLADGRIAHSHTMVPGPDGKFGFGGTCLPKDLAAFANALGEDAIVSAAALVRNIKDRKCE